MLSGCATTVQLVWNSHPKRVMQPIANSIKILLYEGKGTQVARNKYGSLKRDERKQTLDAMSYPVVRIATKAPLHPCCWSTHEEYYFLAIKSLTWTQSQSHWSQFSLRKLAHEGGGLRPPHKVVDAAPHQAGGSLTCRRATNAPRGRRTEIQEFGSLKNQYTRISTLLTHSLKS